MSAREYSEWRLLAAAEGVSLSFAPAAPPPDDDGRAFAAAMNRLVVE